MALLCIAMATFVPSPPARGADLKEAQEQLLAGDYAGCIASARAAIHDDERSEEWQLVLGRALLATGRYSEAESVLTNAVAQDSSSIRLRWLAREALESNGHTEGAADMVQQIVRKVSARPG